MNGDLQFQIAKLLLSDLGSYGFVLSGDRALIELEITTRPTQDLDFFTNEWNARSLTRDFIDLYNIRIGSKFSDDQLLSLSQVRDEGFLLPYFIESLRRVETLSYENFSEYGITREQYSKIKSSALEWADTIEAVLSLKYKKP